VRRMTLGDMLVYNLSAKKCMLQKVLNPHAAHYTRIIILLYHWIIFTFGYFNHATKISALHRMQTVSVDVNRSYPYSPLCF
jgi:hypothetical protein